MDCITLDPPPEALSGNGRAPGFDPYLPYFFFPHIGGIKSQDFRKHDEQCQGFQPGEQHLEGHSSSSVSDSSGVFPAKTQWVRYNFHDFPLFFIKDLSMH